MDTKIEGCFWHFFGPGAEGLKWYQMGRVDEQCKNCFGRDEGVTVAEAHAMGMLVVDEATGTPMLATRREPVPVRRLK